MILALKGGGIYAFRQFIKNFRHLYGKMQTMGYAIHERKGISYFNSHLGREKFSKSYLRYTEKERLLKVE